MGRIHELLAEMIKKCRSHRRPTPSNFVFLSPELIADVRCPSMVFMVPFDPGVHSLPPLRDCFRNV